MTPAVTQKNAFVSASMWLCVALLSTVFFSIAIALLLVAAPLWDRQRRVFHRLNQLWAHCCIVALPYDVVVRLPNQALSGPFIVIANHQSMLDLVALYRLPVPYRTIVKKNWFTTPVGLNAWLAGYIAVSPSINTHAWTQLQQRCQWWITHNTSILIFPEGKRSRTGHMSRFKKGAFELAVATNTPILPVKIEGTFEMLPPGSWRFRTHVTTATLHVFPPVDPAHHTAESLRSYCRNVYNLRSKI